MISFTDSICQHVFIELKYAIKITLHMLYWIILIICHCFALSMSHIIIWILCIRLNEDDWTQFNIFSLNYIFRCHLQNRFTLYIYSFFLWTLNVFSICYQIHICQLLVCIYWEINITLFINLYDFLNKWMIKSWNFENSCVIIKCKLSFCPNKFIP